MKTNKNVVITKDCHSRMSLSGIYNACRCQIKGFPLLNRCVEDAEQKSLSIRLCYKKAFTLIELLVVVLIIGILAAVALPQYQKAVKKARGREVIVTIKALDTALAAYALEHGEICDAGDLGHCHQAAMDISIPRTTYFTHTGVGAEESSDGPVAIFKTVDGNAKLTVSWDETTGRRDSTICVGMDCPAYFGGTCSTEHVQACGDAVISRQEDWDHCPPSYKGEIELTSCELDI